jgi:hypothetical protein
MSFLQKLRRGEALFHGGERGENRCWKNFHFTTKE